MKTRSVLYSLLLLLTATCLLVGEPLRAQASVQGVWTTSFDHMPLDNSTPTSVHPWSDSITGGVGLFGPGGVPMAQPQNWITQNPGTYNQQMAATPHARMNTVHVCLIPSGVHRGEVLVLDGNLFNLPAVRSFQPWSIVNPYWPATNPNYWPGQAATQYRFHNATIALPPGQGELFCGGQCWMADGRLLFAGGTKEYPSQNGTQFPPGGFVGAKYVWQWDPVAQPGHPFGKWYQMADLEVDRWYPTVTYDGTTGHRGIVIGGTNYQHVAPTWHPSYPLGLGFAVNSYEVVRVAINSLPFPSLASPTPFDRKLSPSTSTTYNQASPSDRQYWGPVLPNNFPAFGDYPRIHPVGILDQITALGGGTAPRLVVTGFNGHGIRWPHDRTVDPTPLFGVVGFGTNFQTGQGYEIGQNPINGDDAVNYATSLLLPGPIGGISGQIRRIGGGRPSIGQSKLVETTKVGGTFTGSGTPAHSWQAGPPMAQGRYQGNVVMLPTGDLFAIGGFTTTGVNLVPELFATTWVPMAPHAEARDYHSAAILLPDGRVFVCGGELRNHPALTPNGKDYAIWEPPYFHLSYGSVPATGIVVHGPTGTAPDVVVEQDQIGGMAYGLEYRASWTNALEPGITIDSVVLMRPEALTHHDDGGQRMVRLVAQDDGFVPDGFSGSILFSSPSTILHAPPGWWMLFLVNSAGRPSQAYWIHLQ